MRFARPEFLDDIAQSTPLPMVVDGELGMPLDLSRWDCLWEENGDDSGAYARLLESELSPEVATFHVTLLTL